MKKDKPYKSLLLKLNELEKALKNADSAVKAKNIYTQIKNIYAKGYKTSEFYGNYGSPKAELLYEIDVEKLTKVYNEKIQTFKKNPVMETKKKARKKRTSPLSSKQKAALAKGKKILDLALIIQKKSGTHTIPEKKVYNMPLSKAMKLASKKKADLDKLGKY